MMTIQRSLIKRRLVRVLILAAACTGSLVPLWAQTPPAAEASPTVSAQDVPLPTHPATLEQINRIITLTHTVDRVRKAMDAQVAFQRKSSPQIFPAAFWDDMQAELAKIDWVKMVTPIYQRYFSEEEANAVIAFYSTPVGQKLLDSSQIVTQKLTEEGFLLGKEIGTRVGQKYQKEIEENMKKAQPAPSSQPSPQ